MDDAVRELAKVRSYRISGHVEQEDGTAIHLTGDLLAHGFGRLRLSTGEGRAEMVLLEQGMYLKANSAFWNDSTDNGVPYEVAEHLVGRWVKQPAPEGATTGILEEMGPQQLAACMRASLGTLTEKGTATVAGQAVTVVEDAGDVPGGAPARYYVRSAAPHRLLRAVQTGPDRPGTIEACASGDDDNRSVSGDLRFSRFDDVERPTAPRGAATAEQILRAAGLTGAAGGAA